MTYILTLFLALAVIISSHPATAIAEVKTETAVRKYFAQTPEMISIAKCESEFRQFDSNGTTLRGGMGGKMIGVFQFHEDYHRAAARALGFNIDSLLGNIAYAKTIYAHEGTTPWNSSKHCWGSADDEEATESKAENADTSLTRTLSFGMTAPEVRTLQRFLNRNGYPIALSGPGAKGSETDYFGAMTRLALKRYQYKNNIVCTGASEYGVLGEKTRTAIAKAQ